MEYFEAVERRRSVRVYTSEQISDQVINKAMEAAVLAPNSSNMQTWRIYRVKSPDKKEALVNACLRQSAARTAKELFVFVADPSLWKRSRQALLDHHANHAARFKQYYGRLMPLMYGWRILAPFKWLTFNSVGLFKPVVRRPWSSRDIEEVCIKSTALACENFMLAIAAQGYDSCPMEGFDECRVRRILKLNSRARVVMVISVGVGDKKGVWGERFRLPLNEIYKEV